MPYNDEASSLTLADGCCSVAPIIKAILNNRCFGVSQARLPARFFRGYEN